MPASRSTLLRLPARLVVALAVGSLLLAACGGDDSGSDDEDAALGTDGGSESDTGAGDVPNPCQLISIDELEDAFGFAWSEGEYDPPGIAPNATCTWSDADPAMPAKVVTLSVATEASTQDRFDQSVQEIYDATRAAFSDQDILDPDLGYGDESYRTAGGIYVLDGDRTYTFLALGAVSDEAKDGLEAMVEEVLGD